MPGNEGRTLQCLASLVTMISNFYGRNFMELDGEIEMETLHEGNPKADFPSIISLPSDIMLRFTCLRLSDECTHSEAPCSPSPAGKSSVPFREFDSDDCDSMDIDSQYDVCVQSSVGRYCGKTRRSGVIYSSWFSWELQTAFEGSLPLNRNGPHDILCKRSENIDILLNYQLLASV